MKIAVLLFSLLSSQQLFCEAFVVSTPNCRQQNRRPTLAASLDDTETADDDITEDRRNPDRPELPELKGDFDWDEQFGADDDWITEDVPGKIVLPEVELAAQVVALDKLEEKWRKDRLRQEYEEDRKVGFVTKAETYNGRLAMFFLVTGLLTELWTGVDMPGQVEELLRVSGILGFDG